MSFDQFVWTPRRTVWRWPLSLAAATASIAHVPVIGPHLAEAPYMGEEFVVLSVACGLLAVAVLVCDSSAAYLLAASTCGLAVVGYVATRLVEFPQLADDVGNWFEPFGVVSVVAEVVAVAMAVCALMRPRPVRDRHAVSFGGASTELIAAASASRTATAVRACSTVR